MSPPESGVPSLDQSRRAERAALFLAETMSGRDAQSLSGMESPIADLKHFPRLHIDIGIVAGPMPPARRILAWARSRQITLMVGRLWDRDGVARLVVDAYLWDVGVVVLDNLHLFTPDGLRWWLVGRPEEVMPLRLSDDGPVPTLVPPYRDEKELERGMANADDILAAFLRTECR